MPLHYLQTELVLEEHDAAVASKAAGEMTAAPSQSIVAPPTSCAARPSSLRLDVEFAAQTEKESPIPSASAGEKGEKGDTADSGRPVQSFLLSSISLRGQRLAAIVRRLLIDGGGDESGRSYVHRGCHHHHHHYHRRRSKHLLSGWGCTTLEQHVAVVDGIVKLGKQPWCRGEEGLRSVGFEYRLVHDGTNCSCRPCTCGGSSTSDSDSANVVVAIGGGNQDEGETVKLFTSIEETQGEKRQRQLRRNLCGSGFEEDLEENSAGRALPVQRAPGAAQDDSGDDGARLNEDSSTLSNAAQDDSGDDGARLNEDSSTLSNQSTVFRKDVSPHRTCLDVKNTLPATENNDGGDDDSSAARETQALNRTLCSCAPTSSALAAAGSGNAFDIRLSFDEEEYEYDDDGGDGCDSEEEDVFSSSSCSSSCSSDSQPSPLGGISNIENVKADGDANLKHYSSQTTSSATTMKKTMPLMETANRGEAARVTSSVSPEAPEKENEKESSMSPAEEEATKHSFSEKAMVTCSSGQNGVTVAQCASLFCHNMQHSIAQFPPSGQHVVTNVGSTGTATGEFCFMRLFHVPTDVMITENNRKDYVADGDMYDIVAQLCMEYAQERMVREGNLRWLTVCNDTKLGEPLRLMTDEVTLRSHEQSLYGTSFLNSSRKCLLIATGKGKVRAGIFSRKHLLTTGVEPSTALPLIYEAKRRNMGIVILDPNARGEYMGMDAFELSMDTIFGYKKGSWSESNDGSRGCCKESLNSKDSAASTSADRKGCGVSGVITQLIDDKRHGNGTLPSHTTCMLYALAHSAAGAQLVRYLLDKELQFTTLTNGTKTIPTQCPDSEMRNDGERNALKKKQCAAPRDQQIQPSHKEAKESTIATSSCTRMHPVFHVQAIAFTDSTHNIQWTRTKNQPSLREFLENTHSLYLKSANVHHPKPEKWHRTQTGCAVKTDEHWKHRFGSIRTLWAGTKIHELTNWTGRKYIWEHFDSNANMNASDSSTRSVL